MADDTNPQENNEPKQDDFYGFALYTFKARRYIPTDFIYLLFLLLIICNFRPAEVDRIESSEDNEDGGVTSKAVAVEGSVADFLRKEATSDNDFR